MMNTEEIAHMCDAMPLKEQSGLVCVLEGALQELESRRLWLFLVGKILFTKLVKKEIVISVFSNIWKVSKGVEIEALEEPNGTGDIKNQSTFLEEPGYRKEMDTDKNPQEMGKIKVVDACKEASVLVHEHRESQFGGQDKVVDVIDNQMDSNLAVTFLNGHEVDKVISDEPSTDLLSVGPEKHIGSSPLLMSLERGF
ncbi:hypothetical protein QYF36_019959 [Acer negundo]|nr:hypothetical protein QYF36_019959 [Acer negundo]